MLSRAGARGCDWTLWTPVLGFLLAVAGCAPLRVKGIAQRLVPRAQAVTIKVASFAFSPNVVAFAAGVSLRITAESDAGIEHNLTILSPEGQMLKSIDVPAGQTVALEVVLPAAGRYIFYCDRFLHRPLGMEGVLAAR